MRICPHCRARFEEDLERCPHDGSPLFDELPSGSAFVQPGNDLQRLQTVSASQGRFTIMEKIGQGGWGGVYKAVQHSTRRVIALKVLRKEVAQDPAAQRRFHQEAQAVSRLKHPNTVTLFDFGETPDGTLFMAMEYVEGQTVDKLLSGHGALPALRTIRITRQVAYSLAEAHNQGIIHRDIKPHNVMVTEVGGEKDFVKVLDFGVAKLLTSDVTLTSTGSTFGTPEYMSPEQVQSKDLDARSDLYSLGIVMYEMLTGAPPFSGGSALTVALAHAHKKPPPITRDREVPSPLRSLVKRLLAKDPSERPASATEVVEELNRIEAVISRKVAGPAKPKPLLPPAIGAWIESNWTVVVSATAVVVLLVAGLMLLKRHGLGSAGEGTSSAATTRQAASTADGKDGDEASAKTGDGGPGDGGPGDGASAKTGDGGPGDGASAKAPAGGGDGGPGDGASARTGDGASAKAPAGGGDGGPTAGSGGTKPKAASESTMKESGDIAKPEAADVAKGGAEDAGKSPAAADGGPGASAAAAEVPVLVQASQPGAVVLRGGRPLCTAPCTVRAPSGDSWTVEIKKEGYMPATRDIRFQAPGTVFVQLIQLPLSEQDQLKGAEPASKEDGLK